MRLVFACPPKGQHFFRAESKMLKLSIVFPVFAWESHNDTHVTTNQQRGGKRVTVPSSQQPSRENAALWHPQGLRNLPQQFYLTTWKNDVAILLKCRRENPLQSRNV
jgi:hypothetical protein